MWQMKELIKRWYTYDSRRGEFRSFGENSTAVSSLAEKLWVAEGPNTDWREFASVLEQALAATGEQRYATFLPWSPHREDKIAVFQERLGPATDVGGGLLIARFVNSAAAVLEVRAELGSAHSGLWSLGASSSPDALVHLWQKAGPEADSPITATVAARSAISFALCLDDGLDFVMVRLNDRTSFIPDLLSQTVIAAGGRSKRNRN
jgi:hypothetical protein